MWNFHRFIPWQSEYHYFQIIFHRHPSMSLHKYQHMAFHLDKMFAKTWLWEHFSAASHSINTQEQFTFNNTTETAFFPRMDHFCTRVVGLCCRLCSLRPSALNSINKHKSQNVLFEAIFPLTLGLFSEWFPPVDVTAIKQPRYKDPYWVNKRKNIQLAAPPLWGINSLRCLDKVVFKVILWC